VAAPELVERLAGRPADDVPERDLDAPGAAGVPEDARVPLEREGILADQLRLDPALERRGVAVAGRAPADQTVVGRDLDEHGSAARPGRAGRPGRPDRLLQLLAAQADDLDVGDLHSSRSLRRNGTGRELSERGEDVLNLAPRQVELHQRLGVALDRAGE